MNDGTRSRALQTLPGDAVASSNAPGVEYLRCLLALGQACTDEVDVARIAPAAVELLVTTCTDVASAVVYRAERQGRRAAPQGTAGAASTTSSQPAIVELDPPFLWPAHHAFAPNIVALRPTADANPVGWLWLEMRGRSTPARTLFVDAVAQTLAVALERAASRADERARAEALARREEAMSTFLGDISNEIRTPLTLMLGPLEAAVERGSDTSLMMALRHGQRLRRLVDTLLDLSLIDTGRVEPVLEPLDVAALTRDVTSLFQGAAIAAGVTLTVDCPPLPQSVQLDRRQWEQVIINLVGNAIKFAPSGEVVVSLRAQPGLMTLEVSDTGRGIDPDRMPTLFERFPHARQREHGGLGLALVRELVRLHGGDVEAANLPGRGARLRVCIPMLGRQARAVPHRHVTDLPTRLPRTRSVDALGWIAPPVAPTPVAAAAANLSSRRERIVLVIDHPDLRDYVAGLLGVQYHVQALSSADEALRAVEERDADLVLLDLGNPAIEGLAFLRRLRAVAQGSLMPALLLTWDARAAAHADAIEAGADDVIGKPFAATELLARVGAHMRLSSERRALHRRLKVHNIELEAEVARRTAALVASEAQFKAISNLVPDILWRSDAQGRMEWRSEQWALFTGDDGSVPGMDFVHPDDRERTVAWVNDTVAGHRSAPHEYRLRRRDGAYRWFIARMSPMAEADGAVACWFGSATDIERHQLARHALEAQVGEGTVALARAVDVQQELLHRLSKSQEDERRRIARELHDSLGQYLTALKLALTALAPAIVDPRLHDLVVHLDDLTTEVDRELDDIIAALRPVVLDELGLAGALPGIVAAWSRQSGIAAEALLVQVADERFDDESESTLYRVTQESLTNIVKHAQARNVAVTLTRRQDELQLTVEDDGVGFDVGRHGGGWGLRGMAERARSAGGLLQVESMPNGGTTVLVRLPCRPRSARPAN